MFLIILFFKPLYLILYIEKLPQHFFAIFKARPFPLNLRTGSQSNEVEIDFPTMYRVTYAARRKTGREIQRKVESLQKVLNIYKHLGSSKVIALKQH